MHILKKLMKQLVPNDDEGLFRQIPLGVPGRLYVSPMPFGAYDPDNLLLKIYKHHKVDHVIVLVTDGELEKKARRNLLKKYDTAGLEYSRFIFKDWMAPSMSVVHEMVESCLTLLNHQRIVVHCHAGVGRTAIAVCCVAITVEGWNAEAAMEHVCKFMTINITDEQRRFIKRYESSIRTEE